MTRLQSARLAMRADRNTKQTDAGQALDVAVTRLHKAAVKPAGEVARVLGRCAEEGMKGRKHGNH